MRSRPWLSPMSSSSAFSPGRPCARSGVPAGCRGLAAAAGWRLAPYAGNLHMRESWRQRGAAGGATRQSIMISMHPMVTPMQISQQAAGRGDRGRDGRARALDASVGPAVLATAAAAPPAGTRSGAGALAAGRLPRSRSRTARGHAPGRAWIHRAGAPGTSAGRLTAGPQPRGVPLSTAPVTDRAYHRPMSSACPVAWPGAASPIHR